jgi:hypothetical protein
MVLPSKCRSHIERSTARLKFPELAPFKTALRDHPAWSAYERTSFGHSRMSDKRFLRTSSVRF